MRSDPRRDIIGNREVLRESHDPETIHHRDAEIDALTTLLSPAKAGGITETALIYGPPGSGKTCTTTDVLEEVESEHSVPTVVVDCWDDHTKSRVLYTILESSVNSDKGRCSVMVSTPVAPHKPHRGTRFRSLFTVATAGYTLSAKARQRNGLWP